MASAPLNWLLKIGGATLKTTAKTLSEAVNTLHDSVTNLSTTVTNLGTSKADASTTTTALNNLETNKLNISDLLSLEEIEASTSLTGKGVTAESIKALNSSLGGFTPIIDESTGKITGYKTEVGADTVFPFSSELELIGSVSGNGTIDCSNKISDYNSLTSENFIIVFKNMTVRSVFYRKGTGEEYDTSANVNISKSYNQSTGILSISGLYCYLRSGNSANYADAYVTLKSDVYLKR